MGVSGLLGSIRRPNCPENSDLQRPYDGLSSSSECADISDQDFSFSLFLHDQE